jgi:hypothetical protein
MDPITNFLNRKSLTENEIKIFWEQKYISLSEDARLKEYNALKSIYFQIADEYESLVKDRNKLLDDNILKQYTIKQRKIGIRMIAAAQGTSMEEEAKTFESQQNGTPAGDRSVTQIQFALKGNAGIRGKEIKQPKNFTEWLYNVFKDPATREVVTFKLLTTVIMEIEVFLLKTLSAYMSIKKAVRSPELEEKASNIIGSPVSIGIIKGKKDSFYSLGKIILSEETVNRLDEKELIAQILYVYGTSIGCIKRGIVGNVVYTMLSTSTGLVFDYLQQKRFYDMYSKGSKPVEYIKDHLKHTIGIVVSNTIIMMIIGKIGGLLEMNKALAYVEKMGYLAALETGVSKLSSKKPAEVGNKEAVFGHVNSLIDMIGIDTQLKQGNISKLTSFFNKISNILPKHKA